jgi:aminobenzoyl-glutamate transport protein
MPPSSVAPASLFQRALGLIERVGNRLPNPATLFALLALLVIGLSWVLAQAGVSVRNPATGQVVAAVNLLSFDGLHRILAGAVSNFINFPPLGTVMVCLLGIAVAEHTGLIGAGLRLLVLSSPPTLLTPMVVFAGVMSNAGGDVGYVLLIPLAAGLFHAVGRHPLAGLAAAFAGVSGGFSANLILGTIDVLLSGITQAAAQVISPGIRVTAFANYYFMVAATFVVTAVGWWVTSRIVEPRLGLYTGNVGREALNPLSAKERRGLWSSALATLAMSLVVLWGCLPSGEFGLGFLRDPKAPADFFQSYFIRGLVAFIFLYGLVAGVAYGLAAGTIRSDHDVAKGMGASMAAMSSYLVMSFFAAQFIAYFAWTNLGTITAVSGAEFIRSLGLDNQPILLMIALVLFTATVNLLMGSASAKWALLAPIFVPMFLLLGYTPELTQAAFRVGDSVTNIVTPLMAYFPLVLSFANRYEPKAGIGTMIATMLPYSLVFLIAWSLLLVGWIAFGLPLGPGVGLMLAK